MSSIPAVFVDGVVTLTDDAGHSATLALSMGDAKLSGVTPNGRTQEVFQSRGAIVGVRKTTRSTPQFTCTAILASPGAAFQLLAWGKTSGFTSTTASLGDGATNDCSFSWSYGAETRSLTMDDLLCQGIDITEGSPSTVSFTFDVLGPVVDGDGNTIISSR